VAARPAEGKMRGFTGLVGLLIVVGIAYYLYTGGQSGGDAASPKRQIDVTGVRTDLLAIAQAERIHMASHGKYASVEELERSGAITFSPREHRGYTYSSTVDERHFRVTARPVDPARADWPALSIDETGQVSQQ
jgi:hypothetical protein